MNKEIVMSWKSKILFGVGEVGSLVGTYKIYNCMCPDDYVDNIDEYDDIVDNINEDDNEDNVDDEEGERLFSLSVPIPHDEPRTLGEVAQPVGPNSLDQLLNFTEDGICRADVDWSMDYWNPYGLDEGLRDNVAAKRWVCRWLPRLQQAPRAVLGMTSRTSSGQPPVTSYQPLASSPRRPSRLRPQKAAEIRPPMFGVIWTLSTA